MAAAVEPARPPPIIAMSVYLIGNPGLEPVLLRRERQIKPYRGGAICRRPASGELAMRRLPGRTCGPVGASRAGQSPLADGVSCSLGQSDQETSPAARAPGEAMVGR